LRNAALGSALSRASIGARDAASSEHRFGAVDAHPLRTYSWAMRLPEDIRKRFVRYGRQGGKARALRVNAEARRAIARRAASSRWIRRRFGASSFAALGLPGGEIVDTGLADLANGTVSPESSAVSLAAPRLRREGVPVPSSVQTDAENRLYDLLSASAGDLARTRYAAYLAQIASFADVCGLARRSNISVELPCLPRPQFSRSAAQTSMRDARRAGTYDAISATASIVRVTSASTHGSSALVS
jgi:hypothetical protein